MGTSMSTEHIRSIEPGVIEVYGKPGSWCATYETDGGQKWVEVTMGVVNLSYPFENSPEDRLCAAGVTADGLKLLRWKAGVFATFQHGPLDGRTVAELVDRVFVAVLGCDDDAYEIDFTLADVST